MKRATFSLLLILTFQHFCKAQVDTLSARNFVEIVIRNHPVARQAEIQLDIAMARVTETRGSFDPLIGAFRTRKDFEGTNYYDIGYYGLVVPTWIGVDVRAGLEMNDGVYLNPEKTVPDEGLMNLGVSVPIGKNTWIDQRRAMVKQARLMERATSEEVILRYNDLIFRALNEYFLWHRAYMSVQLFEQATEAARERFEIVKTSYLRGDFPAVDTLEALILYQTRLTTLNELYIELNNRRLDLGTFLWLDGMVPLEVANTTVPYDDLNTENLPQQIAEEYANDQWLTYHPELLQLDFFRQQLAVQRRLQINNLLPEFRIDYNFLNRPVLNANEYFDNMSTSNARWMASLRFPIFLRTERGQLAQTRGRISETEWEIDQRELELKNLAEARFQQAVMMEDQLVLTQKAADNYYALLDAESRKFEFGESSLFLINVREMQALDARIKAIETEQKRNLARFEVLHTLAVLPRFF